MKQNLVIKENSKKLRLNHLKDNVEKIIHQAQIDKPSYLDLINSILEEEIRVKEHKEFERRYKAAKLPTRHDLDQYDYKFNVGVSKTQLSELRELIWMQRCYNLIIMGPSGVGKTFIAAGLVYDAIRNGAKAYFLTMEELINIIKMREISSKARAQYRKLQNADLVAIDDIMLFPIRKEDTVGFFNLINTLHEKASVIITTNKSPAEWGKVLDDEIITTALLDRLLYKCEVLKLDGSSYRIEHRKTIFNRNNESQSEERTNPK